MTKDLERLERSDPSRLNEGLFQTVFGLGMIAAAVGAAAVGATAVSGGTATPVLVWLASGVTGALGAAETLEGLQNMAYGAAGNTWTSAFNFIRDPLGLDPATYDILSNAVGFAGPVAIAYEGHTRVEIRGFTRKVSLGGYRLVVGGTQNTRWRVLEVCCGNDGPGECV